MEVKRREMAMCMLELALVLFVTLSGYGVDARVYREPYKGGGYKLHSVEKEYPNRQGFEVKLVVSSPSKNDTLGRDISPLSFVVR